MEPFDGGVEQQWRKWKKKIISKKHMNRKAKLVVLTLNSDGNVVGETPTPDENQDWVLSDVNEFSH